ncbi:hypothetical protein PC119_g26512 [Phytophthora cactorum]|uniref:Uncharacterized protein n=1 Tax=Phytophthora cactorum TaxID=29920 RepID=A0A8T1AIQ7_9STRA|nr:hypothetical protein PC117_g26558 [Phytophthora cactorum]KAG2960074.1 hypothetical protein PC119_g26512 [Phytophthora cactorum]KAG3136213.1 hypothetical protein PC128_g25939 [Phytophthora cactorum]
MRDPARIQQVSSHASSWKQREELDAARLMSRAVGVLGSRVVADDCFASTDNCLHMASLEEFQEGVDWVSTLGAAAAWTGCSEQK